MADAQDRAAAVDRAAVRVRRRGRRVPRVPLARAALAPRQRPHRHDDGVAAGRLPRQQRPAGASRRVRPGPRPGPAHDDLALGDPGHHRHRARRRHVRRRRHRLDRHPRPFGARDRRVRSPRRARCDGPAGRRGRRRDRRAPAAGGDPGGRIPRPLAAGAGGPHPPARGPGGGQQRAGRGHRRRPVARVLDVHRAGVRGRGPGRGGRTDDRAGGTARGGDEPRDGDPGGAGLRRHVRARGDHDRGVGGHRARRPPSRSGCSSTSRRCW